VNPLQLAEKYGIDLYTGGKTACPKCQAKGGDASGDNLMVYHPDQQGRYKGAFCWGGTCGFTIPSEEWFEENGEQVEEEYDFVGSPFNAEIHARIKDTYTHETFGFRGIRTDTAKSFGILHGVDTQTGAVNEQLYPCTMDYKLTGYKGRRVPKAFPAPIGETGKDCELFGQFKFKDSRDKYCLIVGGELDQLSASQMLFDAQEAKRKSDGRSEDERYERIAVVSSTIGESGAHKQVSQQYAWFNRFERVIICMDNDKAGMEAALKIAQALPKGKAYIMDMARKDPNSYIWDNEKQVPVNYAREFVSAFYKNQAYTPSGIVGSGTLMGAIRKAAIVPKIPLPDFMHEVETLMGGGIPLGVIVNLGSASGTGKSTIIDECVYHWIFNSPHKIGVISLESDCAQYGTKILSRHMGVKIDLIPGVENKVAFLNSPEAQAASDELFFAPDGSHRWHLVDDRDGSIEELKELIMSLIIQCECKVIVLDPLQDILDGMSIDEQAVFMRFMKGTVKSHGVTFINVNHVRKSSGGQKANSTGADIYEEDFQGSSAIFKSAACNLLFTRNKEADNEIERNVTKLKMSKCRWTGNTSPNAGRYIYVNKEHKLYDLNDYLDRNPAIKAEYEAFQMEDEAA
jgi:archaellum biogenesis ATPase FlaH/5S rRNA maturation endonuclease (ribonuclease M5)